MIDMIKNAGLIKLNCTFKKDLISGYEKVFTGSYSFHFHISECL